MTTMETMAVLELHYTLAFLTTAGAFGVLAWAMTALWHHRGYMAPALMWLGNLLLYTLAVLLRVGGTVRFLGVDSLRLWAEVIRWQGIFTILFVSAWVLAERLPFFRRGDHVL